MLQKNVVCIVQESLQAMIELHILRIRLTDFAESRSHDRADFAFVIVSTVVKV